MTESGSRLPIEQDAVARFAAHARELRRHTEAARAAVLAATATETYGGVSAGVDVNGALTSLHIAPSAASDGPDALARTVLAAVRAGHVRALQVAQRNVAAIVGTDSPAVAILHRQETALVPPAPERFDGRGEVGDRGY